MGTRIRVFLNARSGEGDASPALLEEVFRAQGVEAQVTRVVPETVFPNGEATEVMWVAAGGDGTVRLVAQQVREKGRRMGVLALGTLNHFAQDLGLPLELEEAVRVVVEGEVGLVDVASVVSASGEELVFVNNSSLGAYPAMVMDRERMKKAGKNKWASLVVASVKAFVRFRCLKVTFCVEGETRECVTPFLFVGNNEYCLEGASLGKREHLDRGQLCLYLAPGATRWTMLRFAAAALVGRLKALPEFHEYTTKEFTVDARHRKRLRVSLDGEVKRLVGPLTYRILPGMLKVVQRGRDTV